jgi:hypothetical protein
LIKSSEFTPIPGGKDIWGYTPAGKKTHNWQDDVTSEESVPLLSPLFESDSDEDADDSCYEDEEESGDEADDWDESISQQRSNSDDDGVNHDEDDAEENDEGIIFNHPQM